MRGTCQILVSMDTTARALHELARTDLLVLKISSLQHIKQEGRRKIFDRVYTENWTQGKLFTDKKITGMGRYTTN